MSGLILCGRVGKHTDSLAIELVSSIQGKTDCKEWHTDSWGGYERALPSEVEHYVSKLLTQRKRANQRHFTAADRTLASTTERSLGNFGSRQKSPYVWLSPISIGFGGIRVWELQRHNGQS